MLKEPALSTPRVRYDYYYYEHAGVTQGAATIDVLPPKHGGIGELSLRSLDIQKPQVDARCAGCTPNTFLSCQGV